MKYVFYLISLLALTSSACDNGGGGEEPISKNSLSVAENEIAVSHEANTATLTVTADCDWGVGADDKDWCTVSPSGGVSGTSTVKVNIAKNSGRKTRETAVTFRYGDKSLSIPVKQDFDQAYVNPDINTPEGYTLVWSDEFASDKVDTDKWRFENWAPGYVNNELQRYVAGGCLDGHYTAFVEDGLLNIKAMKYNGQVISARMNTRASWTYGYMEARILLPKGKGTWPAFWMMPNDQSLGWPACGEIDIMEEVGYHPDYTSSSIHCKSYNHVIGTQKTKEVYTKGAEGEFHIYALEWTPDEIKSYVDGKQFFSFKNDGKGFNSTWPFNKPFYITLNLAWGGSWGGAMGVDESALPVTMQVDYVRVFQKN